MVHVRFIGGAVAIARGSATDFEPELKIMILEDTEADAELELRELRKAGLHCASRRVETEAQFRAGLDEFAPDIILSDFTLPGAFDGMHALSIARIQCPDTPYIFVSGTIGEERAVEALRQGATDYVLKNNLARLAPAVRKALQEVQQRRKRRQAEDELRDTKERLDSILSSLRDVVWSMSADGGTVLYVSSAVEAIYGRPASEFYAAPQLYLEVIHPEDKERVLGQWLAALQGQAFETTYRILRPDGAVRWLQDSRRSLRADDGSIMRIDGLASDITERKEQLDRIARLSRIHEVLSGINSMIVRIRERQELFQETCRIAVEQGGFTMAWIGTTVPGASKVTPVASMGAGQKYLDEVGFIMQRLAIDPGAAGKALRDKQPVIANDIATDPQVVFKQEALARSYRSLAVLPLLVEGEAIGVLALYAEERGFFDQEEMKLLNELTGDISFALDYIEKDERLSYLAYYDLLTGLPNRTLVSDRLNQLLHRPTYAADEGILAVTVIDLDRFRAINDTVGRHVGDALLTLVAHRLQLALPDAHGLARLHSDCFVAIIADVKGAAEVANIVKEIVLDSMNRAFSVDGAEEIRIAATAGIALFPGDGTDADTLFRNAEIALRRAKISGDKYLFYASQMNSSTSQRLSLETKLRKAVEQEQFVVHYQPKIELGNGRICGLEALIRWDNPETGLVHPATFIPILEELGLILALGRWVIGKAMADRAHWVQQGLRPPRIAVNVSAIQFRRKDFVMEVAEALAKNQGAELDLEITESVIMDDVQLAIPQLGALKEMGVGLAIDDFGTGYSSLRYIAKLPVNLIKIDQSFITNLGSSPDNMSIVFAVISLAHSLRLKVCAEGVETEEHANLLRLIRCDEMQGYLFSRPLSAEKIVPLLAGRHVQ